ncbi:MAG TPA: replication-relaxation family protein [Candidatus Saccharimonadales bacterium]|nr:replication-relaxation family protein [Candidatus Saccharimonadales bacterium]
MTELPKLTKKQQEILRLLYSFRFLNRIQIQALLRHKDPKTINLWLRDLRAKGYVEWIYSTHFAEKTKPAIYFLALNGVRYLRTLTRKSKDEDGKIVVVPSYPPEELRKRYKEPTRSQTYVDRCVLVADCCLALERENTVYEAKAKKLRYYYQTEAAYLLERSYYHFVLDIDDELIHPHLIFCRDKLNKDGKEERTLESYILEIFDPTLPRYRMKKHLSDYVKFLDDEGSTWQEQTNTEQLPIVLFVCHRMSDLIYAKRRTRGLIAEAWYWEDEDTEKPRMRFTTVDKLMQSGLLTKEIWEQA